MIISIPRLVIAAPASGSGKSTVACGLIASLAKQIVVQPFKVGPDYIDPMYHTLASGRISRNLDTWMAPHESVRLCFSRAVHGANLAIIEGVMGLFDGYGIEDGFPVHCPGSTAEVARLLESPVILIINLEKMSQSAGAIALGFREYDPALRLAGVICNNATSANHARQATLAIEAAGLPVFGCIPKSAHLKIPERHLGLFTVVEREADAALFIERAKKTIEDHIDLSKVLALAQESPDLDIAQPTTAPVQPPVVRIAVARDEAFCFYYEDNLDLLRLAGAETVFFSPLHDDSLPQGTDGIYLGGGYPELYAKGLSRNTLMKESLHKAFSDDIPIYAECGGLMYLTQGIAGHSGEFLPMSGLLPGRARMAGRLVMGYRQVKALQESLLLNAGDVTRGHEFHYSEWIEYPPEMVHAYQIIPRAGEDTRMEGFTNKKLLASYIHLHFAARPDLPQRFVKCCLKER